MRGGSPRTCPHVALVCPSDMGNLGTILRTLRGFGIRDLALVGNGADVWNPKVVRASMGALFRMEVESFPEFSRLSEPVRGREKPLSLFMLDGGTVLTPESCPRADRYTLIFRQRGLPPPRNSRTAVRACLSTRPDAVDSLNWAGVRGHRQLSVYPEKRQAGASRIQVI